MRHHVPNLVTASRGVAGLAIAGLLSRPDLTAAAFPLFIFAMLTDLFDGALARRLGAASELGRWLDPISDKVLTNAAWLSLWAAGWCPPWIAAALILRDVLVTAGFVVAHRRHQTFRVTHLARLAVAMEGIALAMLLLHQPWLGIHWDLVGTLLGAITVFLSVAAAVDYLRSGPTEAAHPARADS